MADRYPNAYHFKCPDPSLLVLDASQEICSPAKFVNTNAPKKCNCRFVAKDGLIYLVTNKDIATREELIAEYTHGKGYHAPSWPKTFLGCAEKEKSKFAE